MDYQKHYDALIARARNRVLEGYVERHHVIPRCLGGGNGEENLVRLTAREHFTSHMLLVHVYPGNPKLVFAAHAMQMQGQSSQSPADISKNRQFEWLRKANAIAIGNRRRGQKHSQETKNKIGAIHKGREHSDEERKKRSDSLKGRIPSPQAVEANRQRMTGVVGLRTGMTTPKETRAKQSLAALARADNDGRKLVEAQAAKTHGERSGSSAKAWETRRKNGTDKFTDEQKAKMSVSQKNRNETPEEASARALKAHETRRANGTDTYSAEQRQRMSDAHKGKKQSPETIAKRAATKARNKAIKTNPPL